MAITSLLTLYHPLAIPIAIFRIISSQGTTLTLKNHLLANYTMPHGLSSDEKKLIYSNGSLPDIIPQKLDSKEKVQKWHNCF